MNSGKRSSWGFLIYLFIYFSLIFISWRLITLKYCGGFCHTLIWISHGFTCVPHPDPPTHLPLLPLPPGPPRAPGPSACLMHPTWAGDLFLCYSKSSLVSISLKVKVKVLLMASQFLILSIRLSVIHLIYLLLLIPTHTLVLPNYSSFSSFRKKKMEHHVTCVLSVCSFGNTLPPPWTSSGFTQNAFSGALLSVLFLHHFSP